MRYTLIANPAAGRGSGRRLIEQVHQRLLAEGAHSTVAWSSAPGGAGSLTTRSLTASDGGPGQKTCIVSCGGDGTVQEVVNAILNSDHADSVLGVLPSGRCNDFASALGIRPDAAELARTLLEGRPRRVDLGRIDGKYFCTIAAMGFDAAVSRFVNDRWLPFSGTPAYVLGTLRVLLTYRPGVVKLQFDDSQFEGPVFLAASANTPSYGGKLRIAPHADAYDGLLEVCVVDHISRWRGLQLLGRVLRGQHLSMSCVRFVRTSTLRIETSAPREVWADGEYITDTPVDIDIVPQAIEVMLPPC